MPNWKHLQQLNGGEAIWYSDPQLSLKDEVWLYSAGGELRVWSAGTLHKHVSRLVGIAEENLREGL